MKILKIEFQNINSLKGSHEIDFTEAPFTASSLFAITGPTGSGKSTILDVISLALFNHVPRLGKITRNEILSKGAILTRNQKDAMAAVKYECKNGIFRSEWSISTNRNNNLRNYEMEITEEASGKILDVKKSDVPGRNEELIGLNYNQFIKSVLLAQGEFAQFLRAKKDERGELLEKITGTGIYRQLGVKAFQKHKEVNQEIQEQQRETALIQKDLLGEEELKATKEELAEKEKTCKPLEEEIKALDKNLELKKVIAGQLKEIQTLKFSKEAADKDFKEFEHSYGTSLKQHEKVRDVAGEIRNWNRLTLECANIKTEISAKTRRKGENDLELKDCLKQVSGLIQLEVAQDCVEDQLNNFAQKVRKIQDDLNEKVVDFKSLQKEFHTETRDLPCSLNEKDPEATGKQLEELKQAAETKISELKPLLQKVDLKNPEPEKIRLKKHLHDAQEARNQAENLNRISGEIERLQKEEEKLAPKVTELPKEIQHNEDQVKIFQERLNNINLKKQNQLLLASLEEHRSSLKEGEPCPLCGAVHHPYADELPKKNNELDKEFEAAEKELSHWNTKRTGNITTLQHYNKSLKEVLNHRKAQQENFEKQREDFRRNYSYLSAEEKTDWKKLCSDYQIQLDKLEEYERQIRSLQCVETGLPLIKQMMEISAAGKELREKLMSVYSGKDVHRDTQQLQTRWTELKQLEKAMAEQLRELGEKNSRTDEQLQSLEKELIGPISEKGFKDISEAQKALLPDAEYFRLQSARDKIEKEIAKNQHSLKLLNSQLEKSRETDVEDSTEELIIQRQEKNSGLEKVRNECQHLKRILLNDEERRERLARIKAEISEKEKHIRRWRLLNELIGDSTGKKFNDFAQDLSLSQLLQHANIRLRDLSDRYRIDKPEAEEDDGLVAIDDHMGGQRRSVKTLSGGETFILSLSMALALSDLASKNVEINSLFIDEGFGTLDPETLDQTLDTLEKLQAESSKTIGIISHVDSLKERIATQIQLNRNGQGYSSLRVSS